MAEFLVIRLGASPEDPVSWIAVDDRGTRRGEPGTGSLADAAARAGDRDVIALVPGSDVLTLSVDIPLKGARLQSALPFALEDQVADDIENLHFAPGARKADGSIPVAVVSTEVLEHWIGLLGAAGITPARLVPENHGLAVTPNTLSMLVAPGLTMFNDGARTQFVVPELGPGETIAAAGVYEDEEQAGSKHLVVYCDAAIADEYEADWALLRHELASVDVNLLPDGALPKLAVTVASGTGIDLLQGRYGAKAEFGGLFRPWRYAAMFLLAFGLLGIVATGVDYYRLHKDEQALQAQFSEEYRRLRPSDTRDILDPVATVSSLRRGQGVAADGPQVFLPALTQLSAALSGNTAIRIEAISYRAGIVDVRLVAPDIPTLDKIVQAVGSSGQFSASMQSADRVGEQVNSRIQIREAGA